MINRWWGRLPPRIAVPILAILLAALVWRWFCPVPPPGTPPSRVKGGLAGPADGRIQSSKPAVPYGPVEAVPQQRYGAQANLPDDLPGLPGQSGKQGDGTPGLVEPFGPASHTIPLPGPDLLPAAGPVRPEIPRGTPPQALQVEPVPVSEAAGWAGRSKNLELTAREADLHTQRGFALATRKACFSARAEFLLALRLVADGLDAEDQTDRHSQALGAALIALREAEDFVPRLSQVEPDADLSALLSAHRTQLLHGVPPQSVTPMAALQAYHTFAQQQLAAAAGREVAGSMALWALGKVHRAMAAKDPGSVVAGEAKAIVFFQAALLVNPRNYLASNELGVLLAQGGRCEDARKALEHAVSIRQQPAIWHNLAVVYQQLGLADFARRAQWLADHGGHPATAAHRAPVRWVDPASFARMAATTPETAAPVANGKPTPVLTPPPAPPNTAGDRRTSAVEPAGQSPIRLCQALVPATCHDCGGGAAAAGNSGGNWERARELAWQSFLQGEYVVHARTAHVQEYRLRVDDQLDMIYRVTREETSQPYRLNVGDEVRVESFSDGALNRDLILQPDGTITLRLLGQVKATGLTVAQLTGKLEQAYTQYYKIPAITVTPLKVNSKLEDLRATVDRRMGVGGQSQLVRVTPEGTISLPAIGCVPAQGLTLPEFQQELNERYRRLVEGMEVVPVLAQRAPRFVYVLGEVHNPGRYELLGPTTSLQAIGLAGSWNVGANLRQIVLLRRDDDWRPLATMLNLDRALHGKDLCPADEIWLSDSDVVLVPKGPILVCDDFINLVFTRGLYGVVPFTSNLSFAAVATL
jgi:polysaccharide export outer membrane protein